LLAEQKAGGYSTKYRFTGKEVDEETGLYYFGARYYDPRISLWYGVDPMAEKYPSWNSFNYTMNNPIRFIDPNGKDVIVAGEGDEKFIWTPGAKYLGENEFIKTTVKSLNELTSDPKLANMDTKNGEANVILSFVGSKNPNIEIVKSDQTEASETGTQIQFDPSQVLMVGSSRDGKNVPGAVSATTLLGHEFGHAFLAVFEPSLNSTLEGIDTKNMFVDAKLNLQDPAEHSMILKLERNIAKSRGEGQRFHSRFLGSQTDAESFLNKNKGSNYYGDYRKR
jgi:RHS repeat-associated protein